MFKRTRQVSDPVRIRFEDQDITAERGDSVAAALLGAGVRVFRVSAVTAEPRAPLCLIGNCFECMVQIDGEPNRQACLVQVSDGMQVRMQGGTRCVEVLVET